MTARTCGSCTLCCKVMAVPVIDKPYGKWCGVCDAKKGCTVYDTRPVSCRDFMCLWLQSPADGLPEELRPDRCHVVMTTTEEGNLLGNKAGIVLHVDQQRPDAWRTGPVRRFIDRMIRNQVLVIVACGDRRVLVTKNGYVEAPR